MPIPSVYDTLAEQNKINQAQQEILNNQADYSDYAKALLRVNSLDPDIVAQRDAQEKAALMQRIKASQDTQNSLEEAAQKRIEELVNQGIADPNKILSAISTDPILSQVAATDRDKINLTQNILSQVEANNNANNALAGKTITADKGFLETTADAFINSFKSIAGSPYFDYQQHDVLSELDKLPTKELNRIQQKLDLQSSIQQKLNDTEQKILSGSSEEQARALREREYYKNELSKLGLNREDQKLWDTFGEQYSYLLAKKDYITAKKDAFTGNNTVTLSEADKLKADLMRKKRYEAQGKEASYLNPEYALESIADNFSFNAIGKSIGEVAGSAAMLMIPGWIGTLSKAYSIGSDFYTHYVGQLAHAFEKNGEIPSDREISAAAAAAGSAIADFYGSKLLLNGMTKTGLIKDLERRMKDSFVSAQALKGISSQSAAASVLANIRKQHLPTAANDDLAEAINKITKNVDKVAKPEKVANPLYKVTAGLGKSYETSKKANRWLHQHVGTGIQDIAKAGSSLAFENMASTISDQWGKGEYDVDAIIESGVSGLIGGGGFHAIGTPLRVAGGHVKDWVKKIKGEPARIDSNSEFNASLNVLRDSKNAEYVDEIAEAYKAHYNKTKETLEEQITEAKDKAFEQFGEENFIRTDDGWKFKTPKGMSAREATKGEKVAKTLTKLQNIVDKNTAICDSRINQYDELLNNRIEEEYKKNPNNKELRAKYLEKASEEDVAADLMRHEHLTEDDAKAAAKFRKTTATSDDFEKALSSLGESNYALYADINRNNDAKTALIQGDKTAFDTAINADTTMSPTRQTYLKNHFDDTLLSSLTRNDTTAIDDKGFKRVDGNKVEASFADYSRATQNQANKEFGVESTTTPTSLADTIAASTLDKTSNDINTLGDLANRDAMSPEQKALDQAIRREYFNNKNTPIAQVEQDVENALHVAFPQMDNNAIKSRTYQYTKQARDALNKAHKSNVKVKGKKVYKTQAAAQAELDKIVKASAKSRKIVATEIQQTPEGYYYLHNILEDLSVKKVDELKALVNDSSKTVSDIRNWYESVKGIYGRITYKDKPLTDFIESEIFKKIPAKLDDKAQKETKQNLYSKLTTLTNLTAVSTIRTEAEAGVTHFYDAHPLTKAQMQKFKKEDEKVKAAEDKELNRLSKKAEKRPIEGIRFDVMASIIRALDDARIPTTNLNNLQITQTEVDEIRRSTRVTTADKQLLNDYEARVRKDTTLSPEIQQSLIDNIACLRAIMEVCDTVNDTRLSLITPVDVHGTEWQPLERTRDQQIIINAFDRAFRAFDGSSYPATINYQEGDYTSELSSVAENQAEQEKLRNFKRLKAILHRPNSITSIRELLNFMREAQLVGRISDANVSNMLELSIAEMTDISEDDKSLLRKELNATLDHLSQNRLADLFLKVLDTNSFKQYFGLVKMNDNTVMGNGVIEAIITPDELFNAPVNYAHNTTLLNGITDSIYDHMTGLDDRFHANGAIVDYLLDSLVQHNRGTTATIAIAKLDNKRRHIRNNLHHVPRALNDLLTAFSNTTNATINNLTEAELDRIIDRLEDLSHHPDLGTEALIRLNDIANSLHIPQLNTRNANLIRYINANAGNVIRAAYGAILNRTAINSIANLINDPSSLAGNWDILTNKVFKAEKLLDAFIDRAQITYTDFEAKEVSTTNRTALEEEINVLDFYINQRNIDIIPDILRFNAEVINREAYNLSPTDIEAINSLLSTEDTNTGTIQRFDINALEKWRNSHSNVADKLSKVLQAYINQNHIANTHTATSSGARGRVDNIQGVPHSRSISDAIAASNYAQDFTVRRGSVLSTDNFRNISGNINQDYAGSTELNNFMELIKQVSKYSGYFSYTKGNLADEIFAERLGTTTVYNEEVITTMAGVALSHLTRISSGQSADWVDSMVSQKVFTSDAAQIFKASNYCDVGTLIQDLGTQIFRELGLSSRGDNVKVEAKQRLSLALGERAFGLLDKAGIIHKQYFNKITGKTSSVIPEGDNIHNWMRVVNVTTSKGKPLCTKLNNINATFNVNNERHHLFKDAFLENRESEAQTEQEYTNSQAALEQQFNTGNIVNIPYSPTANSRHYVVRENTDENIVSVELGPNHTVYIPRAIAYKKDHVRLSYARLVEIAEHLDEVQEFNYVQFMEEAGDILNGVTDMYSLDQKYTNNDERRRIYQFLGLANPIGGIFGKYTKAKNDATLTQWINAYQVAQGLLPQVNPNGTVNMHFSVMNTINNRQFVDCLNCNYREFKLIRKYFTPRARVWDASGVPHFVNDNAVPVSRNSVQDNVFKTIILGNFGIDTDKAHIDDMGRACTELLARTEFQNVVAFIRNNPTATVSQIIAQIETLNAALAANPITLPTTKKPEGANISIAVGDPDKVGTAIQVFKWFSHQIYNFATWDYELDWGNVPFKIEVDGLTNGTGIHLATSGYMGNTDEYTLAMLCGVGIFPRAFNGTFRDFVTAKMKGGALDSYELTGQTASENAVDLIISEVAEGIINTNLGNMFSVLGRLYNINGNDIRGILREMFSRSAMKPVLMTNGYGAGTPAIIRHLWQDFAKKVAEETWELGANDLYKFYDALAAANGGSITLTTIDNSTFEYRAGTRDTAIDYNTLRNCTFFLENNSNLEQTLTKYIFKPAADAAAKRTNAAKNHTQALSEGADAIADIYNLAIASALDGRYSLVELSELTNAQLDAITRDINTVVHIGNDESGLDILKDALKDSITILQERFATRVSSYYNDGTPGLVVSAKSKLTKESIASALSPEFNHTKDSDIINRCQSAIRERLGAFLGIHDAAIINYMQLVDVHNVGEQFNKEFFETTLFSYRPLLEMLKQLKKSKQWLETAKSLDKREQVLNKTNTAIDDLTLLIEEQLAGKIKFLQNITDANPATINQYALDGITSYTINRAQADDYLRDILSDRALISYNFLDSQNIGSFKKFVEGHPSSDQAFFNTIQSWFEENPTESVEAFLGRIRNAHEGKDPTYFNRIVDLSTEYLRYVTAEDNRSFFKDVIDVLRTMPVDANRDRVLETIAYNTVNHFNDPRNQLFALFNLIQYANNYGNMGYDHNGNPDSNNSALNRMIMQRASKLSKRYSVNKGSFSILDNFTALTSNASSTDIAELSNLLTDVFGEAESVYLNLAPMNKNTSTIQMDVESIDLNALLQDFTKRKYKVDALNPYNSNTSISVMLSDYIRPYVLNMENQLTALKAKNGNKPVQIVFTMESPIDRMLISAFNREINNAQNGSTWHNVKLVILPPFTNQANGSVNRKTFFSNLIMEYVGKSNYDAYTTMLNNKYKDNEHRNFMYGNKFTPDYIRTGVINKEAQFNIRMGDRDNLPSTKSASGEHAPELNRKDTSFIGTGDSLGYLNDDFVNAISCIPTDYHIASDNYAMGEDTNDQYARRLDTTSDDSLLNLIQEGAFIRDTEGNQTLDASVNDWMEEITEGSRLVIGIKADGRIDDKKVEYIINHEPALKTAYERAINQINQNKRLYDNGRLKDRSSVYAPVTLDKVNIRGNLVKVTFQVAHNNEVNLAVLSKYIIRDEKAAQYNRVSFMLDPDAPEEFKLKFAFNSSDLKSISDAELNGINHFFRENAFSNDPQAERKWVIIPDRILNRQNKVTSHVIDSASTKLARINVVDNLNHPEKSIYLGTGVNRCSVFNNENSRIVDFSSIADTKDNFEAVQDKWTSSFMHKNNLKKNNSSSVHYYNGKPDEDMTSTELALFRDINCTDISDIAEKLNNIDKANNVDNSHLFSILDQIRGINAHIRYRFREDFGRNGTSEIKKLNGVKVAFVQHGISTKGVGSNLETFTHELTHIPLDFLNLDASAYNSAVQLYNFVAKNLSLDHFENQDAEDRRIFNYIFRDSNTADPHIEFLVYALTNARFKQALTNLSKQKNLKDEMDNKLNSIINRFTNKLDSKNRVDIDTAVSTIFKKSLSLMKHYYHNNPVIPKEAYAKQATMLDEINRKIIRQVSKFVNEIDKGSGVVINQAYDEYNPHMTEDAQMRRTNRRIRATDILPRLIDNVASFARLKGEFADSLKQSFKAINPHNWEYVKLRMAAKESVDKAREQSASALNSVVREMTNNIDPKIKNNMPEYILHTDIQCLFDSRDKEDVYKLLTNPESRYQEIKRLENTLKSNSSIGNFYINASRGLANKLVYGINTSGIGYNNAYEIANLSGSSMARGNSTNEQDIDQLVTLYAVHELSKQQPDYYKTILTTPDVLDNLCDIHRNLISQEKNSIYGDSSQKHHIPKGELHGGKVNNRYEIIPEAQLKAYEWAGYKKISNVELDPAYKQITNDKFVAVGAKYLPDIPYSSGIPVLTDIFNGRNKHDSYVGGKKLESTQLNDKFNGYQLHYMQKYMDEQIQRLNKPDFQQNDYKKISGVFSPTYDIAGRLAGSDFAVNEKVKDNYLGRNHKITSALGDHYGSIIERAKAPEWNTKVAEALDELYKERAKKHKFTWLTAEETDETRKELYDLIPYEIKSYFNDKYPDKGIPIEEEYISGILGRREVSASKVNKEYYAKLHHSVEEHIDHVLHSAPVAYTESLMKYLTSVGKENIVIKGITTSICNIASNCVTLGLQGLNPKQVCEYQVDGLQQLRSYKNLNRQLQLLQIKQNFGTNTVQDNAQIKAIKDALHSNPIAYLAENGAIPTIAEDLTETDKITKDVIDQFLPSGIANVFHQLTGDQKSWIYGQLSDLATFGDITAKYALFKHLTDTVGITKDEALRQCVQNFIDYSNPLPKEIQYLDSIGMLPFTKFMLGTQTNIVNSLVKNPAGALGWIVANNWMNVSDIYGSVLGFDAIANRLNIPGFGLWYDSLASLPIVRATGFAADLL